MEQPEGSHMLKRPSCSEIVQQTHGCRFDLCKLGALKDPETSLPICKRLHVRTTSQALHLSIHGKLCDGLHDHRQIAGSTHVNGKRVLMSTFTENYPKKFARQVAKVLIHDKTRPTYAIVRAREADENSESHLRRAEE